MAIALTVIAPGPVGPAYGAGQTEPVVTPVGVGIEAVSHDGRYLWDADAQQAVDRLTGARSAAPPCLGDHCWSAGFVRDRPNLVVTLEYGRRPVPETSVVTDLWNRGKRGGPMSGAYLADVGTGTRQRIDTDPSGAPLAPSWGNDGTCGNEWCDNFFDFPTVFVGAESVSKDGRLVAFCSNYAEARVPVLHVKDLRSGSLTTTGLRCPVIDHEEGLYTVPPQISADGRVVHVNGDFVDSTEPEYQWNADHLYFPRTGATRTVKGWGSMTRDGGSIFMRVGVSEVGTNASVSWDQLRTGVYDVRTRKVTRLPRNGTWIYGHEGFSAFEYASYRGRFVVELSSLGGQAPDRGAVVDRRTGARTDIAGLLRDRGYVPLMGWDPLISGDAKVIVAQISSGDPERAEAVAITGWEPTARATAAANASRSKLLVNVDPDKGSGSWTFRMQTKRADGSWRTLQKVYRTQGRKETRTIDLPTGTYRVQVKAKYGYRGSTSAEVQLAS